MVCEEPLNGFKRKNEIVTCNTEQLVAIYWTGSTGSVKVV